MIAKPVSQVLLKIDTALQEELTTDSGIKFYIDPTYKKEWQASVTATIEALPENSHPKYKKILEQLRVGDEVCISYRVVADFAFQSDGERFMQATEENPHYKEFVNAKGYWIRMYALPARKGIKDHIWVGVYMSNRMNIIDGVQGAEEEIYRWAAQFPFGKTDIFEFKNLLEYEGAAYWRCDPDDIFAVRKKGHLIAVGDKVICKPIEREVPQEALIQQHQGKSVKLRYTDRGRVISGGKEQGINKEDIISFNPQICEKYTFFGMEYYLINKQFILGKWKRENIKTNQAEN